MFAIELPIVTDRLTLRDIKRDDSFAFAKMASHPRMKRKIVVNGEERNVPVFASFDKGADVFVDLSLSTQRKTPRDIYVMAIVENNTNKVIGVLEISMNDLGDIELGYCIHPDQQRKNYATEAATAMCSYVFQRGIQAVTATTRSDNKASQGLMRKLGMTLIGYKPTQFNDGLPIREYWMVERIPFMVAQNAVKQKTATEAAV